RGGTYFLCRRKESRQRKRLTPPALKRVPWLGGGSGASGIRALAHSTLVTRQSYFPPRTACSPEGAASKPAVLVAGGGHEKRRVRSAGEAVRNLRFQSPEGLHEKRRVRSSEGTASKPAVSVAGRGCFKTCGFGCRKGLHEKRWFRRPKRLRENRWLRLCAVGSSASRRRRAGTPTGLEVQHRTIGRPRRNGISRRDGNAALCAATMPGARTVGAVFNEAPRRRAQRRRKNDCLVTGVECARARIPDAPLRPPSQGTRFKAGGVSRFLCLLSLRRQRK
ncbi:hypothetical protein J2794_005740, partial [Paraburkholderia terricola]|nr:hypothetical protein [Paraburkholderia terricola]